MKVVIDRFEGDYAVCEKESREMIDIEFSKLPKGIKEGDFLILEGDLISIDSNETEKRKAEIEKLMESLWE